MHPHTLKPLLGAGWWHASQNLISQSWMIKPGCSSWGGYHSSAHLRSAARRCPTPRCRPWGCTRWFASRGSWRIPPRTGRRWNCPAEGSHRNASHSLAHLGPGTRCDGRLRGKKKEKGWRDEPSTVAQQSGKDEKPKWVTNDGREVEVCKDYLLKAAGLRQRYLKKKFDLSLKKRIFLMSSSKPDSQVTKQSKATTGKEGLKKTFMRQNLVLSH